MLFYNQKIYKMSERKHKYTDLERSWYEEPIKPSDVFLERIFDLIHSDKAMIRTILLEMAKRIEWQYDTRIDPKKPMPYHTEGELTVCMEGSRLGYEIHAPLIHKRVKVWVPEDVYYLVQYLVTLYINLDHGCWMLGRLVENHYLRKEICHIVTVRRK